MHRTLLKRILTPGGQSVPLHLVRHPYSAMVTQSFYDILGAVSAFISFAEIITFARFIYDGPSKPAARLKKLERSFDSSLEPCKALQRRLSPESNDRTALRHLEEKLVYTQDHKVACKFEIDRHNLAELGTIERVRRTHTFYSSKLNKITSLQREMSALGLQLSRTP
ncbi:hypothetical protein C8Q79DRAFT_333552 [Trametes meyenii]|nr:hypothetical protein C8Q79DRAFT_333552 [Trametes meyenii]